MSTHFFRIQFYYANDKIAIGVKFHAVKRLIMPLLWITGEWKKEQKFKKMLVQLEKFNNANLWWLQSRVLIEKMLLTFFDCIEILSRTVCIQFHDLIVWNVKICFNCFFLFSFNNIMKITENVDLQRSKIYRQSEER